MLTVLILMKYDYSGLYGAGIAAAEKDTKT